MIIDLTFTTRYYRLSNGLHYCSYIKILTKGHQVPSVTTILNFKQVVRRFLKENPDNDKQIRVHCTRCA